MTDVQADPVTGSKRYARIGERCLGIGVHYRRGVLPLDTPAPLWWAVMEFRAVMLPNDHVVWELFACGAPYKGECAFERAELEAQRESAASGLRYDPVARHGCTATVPVE